MNVIALIDCFVNEIVYFSEIIFKIQTCDKSNFLRKKFALKKLVSFRAKSLVLGT